jgi:hypothetical protein
MSFKAGGENLHQFDQLTQNRIEKNGVYVINKNNGGKALVVRDFKDNCPTIG